MIPHDHQAVNARTAAQILGKSLQTWRNQKLADKHGLRPLNPGRRTLLYDRAQVEAARDGRPLPALPVGTTQHPDDLLDEQDAAEYLEVDYSTVRADKSLGRLPGWFDVEGVDHIRRATLDVAIAARPGRGVGGGRPRKSLFSTGSVSVPPGRALVLLVVGDVAQLVTALHPAAAPLQVSAERIAEQAGLPANELPGRRFAVERLTQDDADGFVLVDDPRL
ncbi:hypothetical protein DQ384_05215 [Sphaerisporangium album]|uniref:Uncharacterized protein n=1 Tax=Sphaerisporangium album TaxID=509200 RepID=A0A367FNG7_9ACTN|nr:hypothetical protein [Sphaerisporangium album]RCG31943.1 hypothetical protein DQ384_05215 [Sphaerisporangium album]